MSDPDGIEPGQTWSANNMPGNSVRVTVVDVDRIGFTETRPVNSRTVRYMPRRKFAGTYTKTREQ